MVYYIHNFDAFNDEIILNYYKFMPKERQHKFDSYKNYLDKKLCVISYMLLTYALKQEFSINENFKLDYNSYGKPFLADYKDVHCSISHCKTGVACGVYKSPIGVDIQDFRNFKLSAAKRICTENQLKQIMQSDNPTYDFTVVWADFESKYKYTGGINCYVDKLIFNRISTDSFVLSACCNGLIDFCEVSTESLISSLNFFKIY